MREKLRERLEELEVSYEELTSELSSPDVAADPNRLRDLGRRHAELHEIVTAYRDWRKAVADEDDARTLARDERDPESQTYYRDEAERAAQRARELEERLELLLLPKDPNDEKDVVVEIRAGTGGEEAALFAADLYEMYRRFAEQHKWRTEVLSSSPSDVGGFKEIVVEVRGDRAYSRMKHESGVHRVQRIPVTESGGRIHTSTATVAVLPEAEEVDVEIRPEDVEIDVYRSSGPGGQSVNTTDSAVRITHLPTGIVVIQQDEKSQHKNKAKALKVLRTRLYEMERERLASERAGARKSMVGSGDRSERIRTYNFPQGRVTDHRINLTLHKLDAILEGPGLGEMIDALIAEDEAERLAGLEEA